MSDNADEFAVDSQQEAEETGHKTRRGKQVDLQGEETEVAEGYIVIGREPMALKKRTLEIAARIPSLKHIPTFEFQCIKALHEKKVKKNRIHTYAEVRKPPKIDVLIAEAQGAKLGPYLIVFYPKFFNEPDEQEHTIVHELRHFPDPDQGTGLIPHMGFSDEETRKMVEKFLR